MENNQDQNKVSQFDKELMDLRETWGVTDLTIIVE